MESQKREVLSFGGGCFWGVEHAFKQIAGVLNTEVGYQGGNSDKPTYEEVCRKDTGHVEVVLVEFDPDQVSLQRLLDAFFFMHDASQENRQGPDVGPQYRSCIFTDNEEQLEVVNSYITKLKETQVVTTTAEVNKDFFIAEIGHQDYLIHNPTGYCHIGFDVFAKLKQGLF